MSLFQKAVLNPPYVLFYIFWDFYWNTYYLICFTLQFKILLFI